MTDEERYITWESGVQFPGYPEVNINMSDKSSVIRVGGEPIDMAEHYPNQDISEWAMIPGWPGLQVRINPNVRGGPGLKVRRTPQ